MVEQPAQPSIHGLLTFGILKASGVVVTPDRMLDAPPGSRCGTAFRSMLRPGCCIAIASIGSIRRLSFLTDLPASPRPGRRVAPICPSAPVPVSASARRLLSPRRKSCWRRSSSVTLYPSRASGPSCRSGVSPSSRAMLPCSGSRRRCRRRSDQRADRVISGGSAVAQASHKTRRRPCEGTHLSPPSFRDAPQGAGPESITTAGGYGFRARRLRVAPE